MRKQLFSFAQVISFRKIPSSRGGLTPTPPLSTLLKFSNKLDKCSLHKKNHFSPCEKCCCFIRTKTDVNHGSESSKRNSCGNDPTLSNSSMQAVFTELTLELDYGKIKMKLCKIYILRHT